MVVVALALVLAGCGKNDKTTNASATTVAKGIAAKPAVQLSDLAAFGKILTDGDGRTLYIFDKDAATKPQSSCTGGCASTWPALMTSDGAGVGDGVDASKLSKAGTQYVYNGWPLYRFSGDTAAGDTNGQGIGGVWHIAGADGNPVMSAATTTVAPAAAKTATTVAKKPATTTAATSPPATSPPATSPPATSPPTTAYTPY
jgi:predicted lipoprotein with Yx(FWY)xxD motif